MSNISLQCLYLLPFSCFYTFAFKMLSLSASSDVCCASAGPALPADFVVLATLLLTSFVLSECIITLDCITLQIVACNPGILMGCECWFWEMLFHLRSVCNDLSQRSLRFRSASLCLIAMICRGVHDVLVLRWISSAASGRCFRVTSLRTAHSFAVRTFL